MSAQRKLAHQIGGITKELQKLAPPPAIKQRVQWNTFIEERFNDSVRLQETKGLDLPELKKLERFVGNFDSTSFKTNDPVFIHSDLTADHFLVDESSNHIVGVIDFADSMVGHREYDLIAYFCYLFHGHPESQEAFYENWETRVSPERMLMWIILHRFSDLKRYFGEQRLKRVDSFEQLARELFA